MNSKFIEKSLIIICGLPGTGKTTLSGVLENCLSNHGLIDQNKIRRGQGMKRLPPQGPSADKATRAVDQAIIVFFLRDKGVIVEGGHRYRSRRHQLYGIASGFDRPVLVIETVCSEDLAKKRILSRPSGDGLLSDPNKLLVYDRIKNLWENIKDDYSQGHSSHVSYAQFDSENNKLKSIIVQKGIKKSIRDLRRILNEAIRNNGKVLD